MMLHITGEGMQNRLGLNVSWIRGPKAIIFLATYTHRIQFGFRWSIPNKKIHGYWDHWTLNKDLELHCFGKSACINTREVDRKTLVKSNT